MSHQFTRRVDPATIVACFADLQHRNALLVNDFGRWSEAKLYRFAQIDRRFGAVLKNKANGTYVFATICGYTGNHYVLKRLLRSEVKSLRKTDSVYWSDEFSDKSPFTRPGAA